MSQTLARSFWPITIELCKDEQSSHDVYKRVFERCATCENCHIGNVSLSRFIYTTPGMKAVKSGLEESLKGSLSTSTPCQAKNLLTQIVKMPCSDLREQLELLGTISNYHWWPYLDSQGKPVSSEARSYSTFLLWHPQQAEGVFIPTDFVPSSLRNQVVYYGWHNDTLCHRLCRTIQQALRGDVGGLNVLVPDRERDFHNPNPPKRRRVTSRIVPQAEDLASVLGLDTEELDLADIDNMADSRTLFGQFQDDLITDSLMIWREHTVDSDTVLMNDYCPSTGRLLPQKFVHVTSEGDQTTCTCKTFLLNELAARKKSGPELNEPPQEIDDIVLEERASCMHCRFFKEHLEEISPSMIEEQDEDKIPYFLRSINENLDTVGNPIVHLGSYGNTTKFSVRGCEDDKLKFCVVHLTIYQGECWAKCLSGSCQASGERNKKKFPKVGELSKDSKVCSHLSRVMQNFETVKGEMAFFSPEYVAQNQEGEGEGETLNEDPVQFSKKPLVSFNIESGLWEAEAVSDSACRDQFDEVLVEKTGSRLRYIDKERIRRGVYEGPTLVPEGETCSCGGNLDKVFKYNLTVYTRNVSEQIEIPPQNSRASDYVLTIEPLKCQQSSYAEYNRVFERCATMREL